MKQTSLLAVVFLLSLPLLANAQTPETNGERDAVKQIVEAYLSKNDPAMVKRALSPDAKIISIDSNRQRVIETPVSVSGKQRANETVTTPLQRIVAIDVTAGGASVKVESEFPANAASEVMPRKHIQYISLLKLNGEWKIVSILMPPLRFTETSRR